MIQPQTQLTIADNTGARKIMCIRVLGGNKNYASVGDIIIGVVKESAPRMPCLLYTSPSPRDGLLSRMPSSA